VPLLDDLEKEWGENSQRSAQPKVLPMKFRCRDCLRATDLRPDEHRMQKADEVVPTSSAQEVTDVPVAAGMAGILIFSPVAVSFNIGTVCQAAGKSSSSEGRARHSVRAGMHVRWQQNGGQRTARSTCPNVSISM